MKILLFESGFAIRVPRMPLIGFRPWHRVPFLWAEAEDIDEAVAAVRGLPSFPVPEYAFGPLRVGGIDATLNDEAHLRGQDGSATVGSFANADFYGIHAYLLGPIVVYLRFRRQYYYCGCSTQF